MPKMKTKSSAKKNGLPLLDRGKLKGSMLTKVTS